MPDRTPAIYFHPDAIEGKGKDLVGRRSAGSSFLKGWLRTLDAGTVPLVIDGPRDEAACRAALGEMGETRPLEITTISGRQDWAKLGCIFFPGPGYQLAPWVRRRTGAAQCSLVGITHTVSTGRVVRGLHDLLSEPVEDWDAIICTSRAVHGVTERLIDEAAAYYRARFGAARVPRPRLPIIPLGIETEDFAPRAGARDALRARFQVPDDAIVIMSMGRLSVVEKANPVPLLLAANILAGRLDRPVHVWICGWTNRKEEEALHKRAAERLAGGAAVRLLDGRDPTVRRDVWAAADIFTLPVDSIQETFGLVPVEAMAAGLPVVMPDWDGFRDTVIDGETGFLVPTRMAGPGFGPEIGERMQDGRDGYLQYLVQVQSQVALDIPAYAEALGRLASDAELRARMGAAARAHARRTYDWSAVTPRYMALADDLARARAAAPGAARAAVPGSHLELDPFSLYAGYPSGRIGPDTPVSLRLAPKPATWALLQEVSGRALYQRGQIPPERLADVCRALADGPASAAAIAGRLGIAPDLALTIVSSLLKFDLARLETS